MSTAGLFLELGAILLALACAARLGTRFGLSPIPLYLLVGLAIGKGGLVPVVTADRFIEAGAEIGVVLLLLMLGLEYTPEELAGGLRTTAGAAVVDLAANFLPGLAAGLLLGWGGVAAVVLGGVTYISSSGIVAKLVDDLGWLANRETPTVLSLLVAEDLVMAVYLPLVAALLVGGSVLTAGLTLAGALGAAGLALFVAFRFSAQISAAILSRSPEGLLLGLLGVTLLVAGAAEHLHISAAVGAFLVGVAFSGRAAHEGRPLLRPLRDLFAATFFVFFGLVVDPAVILQVALPASLLAVVTATTKYFTGWWATRRVGIGPRGRRRAGAVLVARGEFSIIVAELGVAAAVHPRLGPLAAAYVLILAVVGSLAARFAA